MLHGNLDTNSVSSHAEVRSCVLNAEQLPRGQAIELLKLAAASITTALQTSLGDAGQHMSGALSSAAAGHSFGHRIQEEVVILPQAYAITQSVAGWSLDINLRSCAACSV